MKIKQKTIISTIIFVLLPSLIIGGIAYNEAKKGLQTQIESANELATREVEIEAQIYKDLASTIHEYASENIEVNMDVARDKFKTLCGTYAELAEDGETLICESGSEINDKDFDNAIVKEVKKIARGHASVFSKTSSSEAKKISTTVTSGMYKYGYMMETGLFETVIAKQEFFSKFTKVNGIFKTKLCDPINNQEGVTVGSICVGITETDVADRLIKKFAGISFGSNGHLMLINMAEGENKGKIITNDLVQKSKTGLSQDNINGMLVRKEGKLQYVNKFGNRTVASFMTFAAYDWLVVAEQEIVDVQASIASVRNTIALSSFILLLVAVFIGVIVSNRIVGPIRKLTAAGNKIASGELDTELPVVTSKDEIKDLSDTMNMLVGALRFLKSKQKK